MRKIIAVLSGLLLLAACTSQPPSTAKPSSGAAPAAAPAWPGKMSLQMQQAGAGTNILSERPATFDISLSDENNRPVTGASVKISLVMPTMDMGKNEFTLADKGGGNYEGSGKFTMAGPWNVVVSANGAGKTGQKTFTVVVARQ